jgi:hypothetical protein
VVSGTSHGAIRQDDLTATGGAVRAAIPTSTS